MAAIQGVLSTLTEPARAILTPIVNLFRSLKHPPFALLWSGQTISRLGYSLYRIALSWWVLEKTGSATAMGTVLIFSFTPMLLFLLIGGVVVDRFPRLRVMLLSDLLSGAVVGIISLLTLSGRLEVWHIYIASVIFGFVEAFFFPAYTAIVPEITPNDMLPSANSLTSVSMRVTGIVGPALGASLVALGGTSLAFGLDALSFFISAACIFPILRSSPTLQPKPANKEAAALRPARGPFRQALDDLGEGWKIVAASSWLWITIAILAFINITDSGPRSVSLPFLVKENLGADVGTLGLFNSMSSVGSVIGAVWLGSLTRIRRRGLLTYLSMMISGLLMALCGISLSIATLTAAFLLYGVCSAVCGLIWTNTLQELVPRDLLGRVSSIDALGSFVLLPIGYGIAGWATDLVGAPLVFLISGLATAALTLLGLLHPAIRNLD